MSIIKLSEGEFRLMELLWVREPVTAKELADAADEKFGWNKNTTYTVLRKLVDKKAVRRGEPYFVCTSLVGRDDARLTETKGLIERLYGGSRKALFSALLEDEPLDEDELDELKRLIERGGKGDG